MVSFVHPGKNSLVSFDPGVFCPTFQISVLALSNISSDTAEILTPIYLHSLLKY